MLAQIMAALKAAGASPKSARHHAEEIAGALRRYESYQRETSTLTIAHDLHRLARHLRRTLAALEGLDQETVTALAFACSSPARRKPIRSRTSARKSNAATALERIGDDLRVVAAVAGRSAVLRRRDASPPGARRLFAQCAMAWKDATGRWPAVDCDQSDMFNLIVTLSLNATGASQMAAARYRRAYSSALRFASAGELDARIATPQDFLIGHRRPAE